MSMSTLAASILTLNDTMSWREAVEFCEQENKILRKERPNLIEDMSETLWTRIYEKEHFVYLIGENSEVTTKGNKIINHNFA